MCAASFFKRVVNTPRSLCLVVGGVMSGALPLGGVMTVNRFLHYYYLSVLGTLIPLTFPTAIYLTIIPRACVGYEMIDSQRGA